jgi:transposase
MNRAVWLQDRRMQKFRDVLSRWERGELSMMEAGELLGMSERQFRRYRGRYEEDGAEGLVDRRLGKPSPKRVPAGDARRMLELYGEVYRGWNVKHFYERLVSDHGFRWGYTWVKTQLHTAGLVERAKRRGAHRRKRERKPWEGMMLHQDGSRATWLAGRPQLDLIVTMDDATSTIYSAFLVEEEGTASTFRALVEVFTVHGLPSSLYTDRGSHYFHTPEADGPGRQGPADPGRPGVEVSGSGAHPGLFAAGARTQRADVRHPARPADQGAGEGRSHRDRRRQCLDPGRLPAGS